jgi:hypothetical protein
MTVRQLDGQAEELAARTRPLIADAERGQHEHGLWTAIADNVIAIQRATSGASSREIGKLLGKSETWVRDVVAWRTSARGGASPFANAARADNRNSDAGKARRVLRENPETVVAEIGEALKNEEVLKTVVKAHPQLAAAVVVTAQRQSSARPPRPAPRAAKPADPWKPLLKGIRDINKACALLDEAHENFNEDVWNTLPVLLDLICADAEKTAARLRDKANFLEMFAEAGRVHAVG